jgi:glycerate-2-kinase
MSGIKIINKEEVLSKYEDYEEVFTLMEDSFKVITPYQAVINNIDKKKDLIRVGNKLFSNKFKKFNIVSIGQSAVPMANAAKAVLGDMVEGGYVISSDNKKVDGLKNITITKEEFFTDKISKTGEEVISFLKNIKKDSGLIVLISGNGNKMVDIPYNEITLHEVKDIISHIGNAGGTLEEINIIQRGISYFYNELFLNSLNEENTSSLIISNIPSGAISAVSCGPTFSINLTRYNPLKILQKYNKDMISTYKKVYKNVEIKKNVSNTRIMSLGDLFIVLRKIASVTFRDFSIMPITTHYESTPENLASTLSAIANTSIVYGFPVKKPFILLIGGNYTVPKHNNRHPLIGRIIADKLIIPEALVLSISTSSYDSNLDYAGIIYNFSSFRKVFNENEDYLSYTPYIKNNFALRISSDLDLGDFSIIMVK